MSFVAAKFGVAGYSPGTQSGDQRVAPTGLPTVGTGDFTMECWVKAANTSVTAFISDSRPLASNPSNVFPTLLCASGSGAVQVAWGGSTKLTSTTNIRDGSWHHVAVCRSAGTARLFIDGTQEGGTYSSGENITDTSNFRWCGTEVTASILKWNGEIDEARITAAARYTSSFTAPSEAFPDA